MGVKIKSFGNRLGNTGMITPRVAGTTINTGADAIGFLVSPLRDVADVLQNTGNAVRDVFIDSWTKGKRYQRVGNIVLSPLVAAGTAVEGAVRTAVTPVVNGVANAYNTTKNTIKNTWRSSFGRLFSKKPISDFSYDNLATANIIDKNKNRFSKLQFGKKKGESGLKSTKASSKIESKHETNNTTKNGTTAGAAIVGYDALQNKINNLEQSNKDLMSKIEKLQASMSGNIGDTLSNKKNTNNESNSKKEDISKGEKNNKDKGVNSNIESSKGKDSNIIDAEHKFDENVDSVIKRTKHGDKVLNRTKTKHPDIKIKFDSSTANSKISGKDKEIIIGTNFSKGADMASVLGNDENNLDRQIEHSMGHELSHLVIESYKEDIKPLLNISKKYNGNGKNLSVVANGEKYDTLDKKAQEDACELLSLYIKGDKNLDNYLNRLKRGEIEGLAKISDSEGEEIKSVCKNIIAKLSNN